MKEKNVLQLQRRPFEIHHNTLLSTDFNDAFILLQRGQWGHCCLLTNCSHSENQGCALKRIEGSLVLSTCKI